MKNLCAQNKQRFGKQCLLLVAVLMASGCMLKDVKTQQATIDALCTFSGTVTAQGESTLPIVVGLARFNGSDVNTVANWSLADHFVLENAGRWVFMSSPGTYSLVAFEDRNADGIYEPGNEPFLRAETDKLLKCSSNERMVDLALTIPAQGRSRKEGSINFAEFQARSASKQDAISLGKLTVYGKITTIDDPKFSDKVAADSLWRPYDFAVNVGPGVYFLEKYDAKKIPVLFVHGINGQPGNFKSLIAQLDRSKYQPWVYYYPSGSHLAAIADHLDQTMKTLQLEYRFSNHYVIAHSMGGLVSRGFLFRNQTAQSRARIPLYITIATPWAGHKAAEAGVKWSPAVVRVWNDMVPNSPYIHSLFYANAGNKDPLSLPSGIKHHLLFDYKGGGSESSDGTVTVASQLDVNAQAGAVRLYGYDETHMSVLDSEAVSKLVNGLLDEASR